MNRIVRLITRRRRVCAIGFVAIALILLGASTASAHASLETVAPANDSVVSVIASEVVLRFDSPVALDLGAGIRVFGPDGRRVDRSVSRLRDLDRSVAVSLDDAGAGTYTVAWRVVSEDAHVLRGSSVFHVRTKTGAVATAVSESVPAWLAWLSRYVVLVAATLLIGASLVSTFVLGNGDRSMLRRLAVRSAALLLAGSVVRFAVQVAAASGRGLFDAMGLWGEAVSSTRPGALDALRSAAAGAALIGALRWSPRHGPKLVALGTFAAVATNSLGGHAWTAASRGTSVAADIVHQGAAGAWAGGLVALLLVLRPPRSPAAQAGEYVSRFGRVAIVSAAFLAGTGAWAGYVQVGSFTSLTTTNYGRMVLAKLAGFAVMGGLGWMNRRRLRRAVVKATHAGLRFELLVAAMVLAVSASLVGAVPVRAGSNDPFYVRLETPSLAIDVTVVPAKTGLNTMHLYFYDAAGNPDRVDVATASLSIGDIPPRRITLLPITADHFTAAGFILPMKGLWTLTLSTGRRGTTNTFTMEVPIK